METTENNKLIAEFMGWKEQTDSTERWFGSFREPNGILHKNTAKEPLLFHTSWDWLMPVTTKAFNKACKMDLDGVIGADNHRQAIMDAHTMFDKESVYKAVVEFIKWYNKNKED
jgi:hypothetical protein